MSNLETRTVKLKCCAEGDILSRFVTNAPIETLKEVIGVVQDANINLSEGDEVSKFQSIIDTLGYSVEYYDEDDAITLEI